MIDRRQFLQASAGAIALAASPTSALSVTNGRYQLAAGPAQANLMGDTKKSTDVWAYNRTVPGPVLRGRKGEPVEVTVLNQLEQPTTIHWHGIRIDNKMDGVAGLTQEAIPAQGDFTYIFTPPDAGTYWYHPHNRSWEQMARGLYGVLIVEGDAMPGMYDRDLIVVADDWRVERSGKFHEDSLGNLGDWSHAGRLGNILTLNGKAYDRLPVISGERVRLRLVNTANARILRFTVVDHPMWIVALDGQPVPPFLADEKGVELAPAQRADVILDINGKPGDEIAIGETSGEERLAAGYLVCAKDKAALKMRTEKPKPLIKNAVPVPNLEKANSVELVMQGGAMGGMQNAIYKGVSYDGRTLAIDKRQTWALNGVAGMPDQPLFTAKRGETVKVVLQNQTGWPHGMHVHGHHFHVLSRSSRASQSVPLGGEAGAFRDTVLMGPEEKVEIALVADNPGKWMLHCHMLEHQASGMKTWFEVT